MNKEELEEHLKENGVQFIVGAYGEGPGCEGLVEKRGIKIDGKGDYTKLIGCSYLFKGFPDHRVIEDINIPKKLIKIAITFLNTFWGKILGLSIFILPNFITRKFVMRFVKYYYDISQLVLKRHQYPRDRYCPAVREIDRALRVVVDQYFGDPERKYLHGFKDSLCMILEMDAAYKWRFQEFCSLFNKKKLKENAIKEIKRVFSIYANREKAFPDKVDGFRKVISLLRFNKLYLNIFTDFIFELDLEKVKLDDADWFFCLLRNTYDFGGMSLEERKRERERINKERGHNIPRIVYQKEGAGMPKGRTIKTKAGQGTPISPLPEVKQNVKEEKNKN